MNAFQKEEVDSKYMSREDVGEKFPDGSWQKVIFSEFSASLLSETRPFPCIFGVQGFKDDQLRYLFMDDIDAHELGAQLGNYLSQARSLGQNTSFVVFSKPKKIEPIDNYRAHFWNILRLLSETDKISWPENIPEDIADNRWEFSYAGEPIFFVCNTPDHVFRQSRRASAFMLTFQPR